MSTVIGIMTVAGGMVVIDGITVRKARNFPFRNKGIPCRDAG